MVTQTLLLIWQKEKKMDDNNYDIWHRKIQYPLNGQEVLKMLTNAMIQHEVQNLAQHQCDMEAYNSWVKIIMHVSLCWITCTMTQYMWNKLKIAYSLTFATRLWEKTKISGYIGDISPTYCVSEKTDTIYR